MRAVDTGQLKRRMPSTETIRRCADLSTVTTMPARAGAIGTSKAATVAMAIKKRWLSRDAIFEVETAQPGCPFAQDLRLVAAYRDAIGVGAGKNFRRGIVNLRRFDGRCRHRAR